MNYEIMKTEEMRLVGFSARANNFSPDCAEKIGMLWRDYFGAYGQSGERCYCVYTDYQSDEKGDYTAFVGQVSDALCPEGQTVLRVPAGLYAVFTLNASGADAARETGAFWQALWASGAPRRFAADFEEYGGQNVRVFIGIKEEDVCAWRRIWKR